MSSAVAIYIYPEPFSLFPGLGKFRKDGRAGLDMAASSQFDAIVLDVMLPGVDGFEVARRLRKGQNQRRF